MILAADIGFSNYGLSVVDSFGKVINVGTIHTARTKQKLLRVADDDVQRITKIVTHLSHVIQKYKIQGVVAELPPSGGQSASAVKALSMAVALSVAVFTERKLPIEWATPTEVKEALTGKKTASKEEIMKAVCHKYAWPITEKIIHSKKTGKQLRKDLIYHPLGKSMGKNDFEHIADSLGAYEALKNSNVVKMFIKNN